MIFENKILLITGGTGSFGSTVVKRFIDSPIKEIRVFSRDEKKQHEMRLSYNSHKLKFYIGDVRDVHSMEEAFCGVNFVFHAAALKQVPSCEFFPLEATKTNVLGTHNVIKMCNKNKVEKLICLSTDKAAYPINAMGISKALMEKVAIAESRNSPHTTICVTRYGNVMASRGSVIPLFINQIMNKNPITITDGEMTRFMMSLTDAVELVLYAFKHGGPGDLFVQKAPASTVLDVARSLKELFKSESPIVTIGVRHGEKLFETLLTKEEFSKAVDLKDYYKVPPDGRDLNYNEYFELGSNTNCELVEYNSHNTDRLNLDETKELLLSLDYVAEIQSLKLK